MIKYIPLMLHRVYLNAIEHMLSQMYYEVDPMTF